MTSYNSQDWNVQLKQSSHLVLFHISDVAPEMTPDVNALHSHERASEAWRVFFLGRRSIAQLARCLPCHSQIDEQSVWNREHFVKKIFIEMSENVHSFLDVNRSYA